MTKFFLAKSRRRISSFLILLVFQVLGSHVYAAAPSDTLLHIVQRCIDLDKPNYCGQCRLPQLTAGCPVAPTCKGTIDLWAEDEEYVAMRDIKMCGCPEDFVHGLVLPKATITGVEDPKRPDSIWLFSWRVGISKIPAPDLALVVNPRLRRTQNQLHVHLVKLKPESRSLVSGGIVGETGDLSSVWRIAQKAADQVNMSDFGIMVVEKSRGNFGVVISSDSPESLYTQAVCRPEAR
ncbi:MAG: CDP-diacylglycerol diphosphatase [Betaproteobacteria bacterium]